MSLARKLKYLLFPAREREPATAYDLWAAGYDDQPGNLMLDLDESVFSMLFARVNVKGKSIADIGCGTGRHWKKMLDREPASLTGFDVSAGMLQKLKRKFPTASAYLLKDHTLPGLAGSSCDLLVSTLAVAHMERIEEVLQEWDRVLRRGAEIIITDYHPLALAKGGKRTFTHNGKTVAVKNHIHPIEKMRKLMGQLGWEEIRFVQRVIDGSVREYYVQQDALPLFEAFLNVPILYGIHLKKKDGSA